MFFGVFVAAAMRLLWLVALLILLLQCSALVLKASELDESGKILHRHRLTPPALHGRAPLIASLRQRVPNCTFPQISDVTSSPKGPSISFTCFARPVSRPYFGLYFGAVSMRHFHDEHCYIAASRAVTSAFAALGRTAVLLESKARCAEYHRYMGQFDFIMIGPGATLREWQLCEASRAVSDGVPVMLLGSHGTRRSLPKLAPFQGVLGNALGCVADESSALATGAAVCAEPQQRLTWEMDRWSGLGQDKAIGMMLALLPEPCQLIVVLVGEAIGVSHSAISSLLRHHAYLHHAYLHHASLYF